MRWEKTQEWFVYHGVCKVQHRASPYHVLMPLDVVCFNQLLKETCIPNKVNDLTQINSEWVDSSSSVCCRMMFDRGKISEIMLWNYHSSMLNATCAIVFQNLDNYTEMYDYAFVYMVAITFEKGTTSVHSVVQVNYTWMLVTFLRWEIWKYTVCFAGLGSVKHVNWVISVLVWQMETQVFLKVIQILNVLIRFEFLRWKFKVVPTGWWSARIVSRINKSLITVMSFAINWIYRSHLFCKAEVRNPIAATLMRGNLFSKNALNVVSSYNMTVMGR